MSSEGQQNWQKKLEDLEAQINNSSSVKQNILPQIRNWFAHLPTLGKVVVVVGGVMFALSLLNTVFWLVRLLLSLTVLGVIVYVGYKLFLAQKNQP
jgi:hypothetical protein